MIKRICSLIILLIAIAFTASAVEGWKDMSKGFQIQGGVGGFVDIAIESIPAQTENYRLGMPFNVEDIQVQNTNQGSGRKIAEWSLVANEAFELGIKAEKMKFDGTPQEGQKPKNLDYIISFAFRLSDNSDTQYFTYNTETASAAITGGTSGRTNQIDSNDPDMKIVDILGTDPDRFKDDFFINNYVGILNENVYFKFVESPETISDDTLVPPGSYSAQVTLMIRSVDK